MLAFLWFFLLFNVVYCEDSTECTKNNPQLEFSKHNVVLFFTKPDVDCKDSINDSGIKYLKFPVEGFLQPANGIPKVYQKLFLIDHQSTNCEEIFNKCLANLVDWSINVRHMVTATITTSGTHMTMDSKYPNNNLGLEYFRYSINQPEEFFDQYSSDTGLRNNEYFGQFPLKRNRRNAIGFPALQFENYFKDFPVIEAFNPLDVFEEDIEDIKDESEQETDKPTTVNKELKQTAENINSKSSTENYGQKLSREEEKMIQKNSKDLINAFDLFTKIRDMFLTSFFNINPIVQSHSFHEENSVDISILGKKEERPLYDLVKITLETLQKQTKSYNADGFLLVAMGGNLTEIESPFSELIQTVKYVMENTNQTDTLILLSCACTNKTKHCSKRKVPFYAAGENSNGLRNVFHMVDLFEYIKNTGPKWSRYHSKASPKMSIKKTKNSYDLNDNDLEDNYLKIRSRQTRSTSSRNYIKCVYIVFIFAFIQKFI